MAKVPFIQAIGASVNSTTIVPSGKYFSGTLLLPGSITGGLTIAGASIHMVGGGVNVKPLVIPGGSAIVTTSNFVGGTLTGFLYDN